jgi:hypothetical protein
VFPPGSRIGLAPPPDMDISKRFTGFESRSKTAVITAVEMPPEAFKELNTGLTSEKLKAQGITVTSRETFRAGDNEAVLVTGDQTGDGPATRRWLLVVENPTMTAFVVGQKLKGADADAGTEIRDALKSVAIRPPRSLDEQVSALPFRVGDLGGFRPVRVVGGNSLVLTEGPSDVIQNAEQPALIITQSTPAPPRDQRDAFAVAALRSSSNLKDIKIERSQSFRQRGSDWHEIVAGATESASGRPVVAAQTLRFAGDHYVRVFGMVKADAREGVLSRFRTVSDSIETD